MPDDLTNELKRLIDEGYGGFNLTLPHKELALTLCNDVDELAHDVGAVNTIYIKDGKSYGTNTDVFGFIENIREHAPEFDFKSSTAIVLGAGGAAKAAVYGLLRNGVREVRILNRSREKAEIIADIDDRIDVYDWAQRNHITQGCDLLVNATSLGMSGQENLDIDLSGLPHSAVVNDVVYAPLMTPLLKDAQEKDLQFVTGIGMLLHQARPAFHHWFGIMPEIDGELIDIMRGA